MKIVPIVEGHGEQDAIPLLLRRIAGNVNPQALVKVGQAIRVHKHQFVNNDDKLRRYVSLARLKAGDGGAIIIILDADDDCAANKGPTLLAKAQAYATDRDLFVAFAIREYETWLLASLVSLRGQYGIPQNVDELADVETIDNPKSRLDRIMGGRFYRETIHQAALTAKIDIQLTARNSQSFSRLYNHVCEFLRV